MKTIKLTKNKVAQVSDDDFEWLSKFKWCASLESRGTKWYAVRWSRVWCACCYGKRTKIRMHCLIMNRSPRPGDGLVVHHKDDDGLNNQRENLEIVTQERNMQLSKGWRKKAEEPCL